MAKKLREFQELMHWTNEEMLAQFHWAICVSPQLLAVVNEAEEEFAHLASLYNDAEMYDETMWIAKHC